MVRVFSQYVPSRLFVLVLTENILIVFGIWLAVCLAVGSFHLSLLSYPAVLGKAILITCVCQACLYLNDLYDLKSIRSRLEMGVRLLKAFGMATMILAAAYIVVPQAAFGTGIVEVSVPAIVILTLLWRVLVEWVHRAGDRERILIVGAGRSARALNGQLQLRPDLHLRAVGWVSANGVDADAAALPGLLHLGALDGLSEIVRETQADRVVIALEDRRGCLPVKSLLRVRLAGVPVEEASSLYERLTGRIPIDDVRPSSLIFSDVLRRASRSSFYRRLAAIAGSALGLLVLSPLMALIAVAVKLDSSGPVFYRQTRVGLDGRVFEILKFRSMNENAECETGPVWARKGDPRVTHVGRVLRTLRLDELPQLLNVLRGEMNFIGPRPERPCFVDVLRSQVPYYDVRHVMRPGVTGWAQVSYKYGSSMEEAKEKLEYDLFYLKNFSLSLDFLILFQTLKIAVFGRGAR